jgi:pimeloyl-ACP methyl ester carboxylesterase
MAEEILASQKGSFIPVGLSMGGYVAAELARLAPERLDGMALLSTGPHADEERQKRIRRELVRMSTMGKFKGVTPRLLPRFLSPAALQNETLASAVMAMGEAVGQHNFALQQEAIMNRREQMGTLAQFHKPSLVLCGDLDELTPPELAHEMAGVLRDAELVILPDVGHLSAMEAPDEVTAALLRLIDRIAT